MPIIDVPLAPHGAEYLENHAANLALLDEVRALEARVRAASARKAEAFARRGQLLPRERVARLLDPGSPFLELSTLAGYQMHDDDGDKNIAGGGNIVGIGVVSGTRCLVIANDAAIKGGAISPMGLKKSLRAQEIALRNRLPVVNLVESAGANLLYQAEIFVDGGKVFRNQARLSAAGIPQVTVTHGSSTAGGAYLPGLSDYNIVVRGKSKIFLAGPPLTRAAIGEVATDEELGGAQMHATVTGTAEYMAEHDAHAIAVARDVVARLGWDRHLGRAAPPPFRPPRVAPEHLLGLVPADYRKPQDVRHVIACIADDSDFLDFKPDYGEHTVCGHASIEGHPVGILGNNGPIYPEGAAKATHFIHACCQSGTPLIYLQNTTGYMVGREAEEHGIVKHGSKMIQAVVGAGAVVPQLTVILGASFGAGNYGMCGRAYDPRFIFAWPQSRIAVMGGDQAAKVMEIVTEGKMKRRGLAVNAQALSAMSGAIRKQLDKESCALYATARLWDDGIIDPRDTRRVLALCLAVCREGAGTALRPSTFGVARI